MIVLHRHLGVHGDSAFSGAQVQGSEVVERGAEARVPEDDVDVFDPFFGEGLPGLGEGEAVAPGGSESFG